MGVVSTSALLLQRLLLVRFAAYRQEMPGRAGYVRTLSKVAEELSFRAETALSGSLNSTLLAYKHVSASTMSGF